MEHLTYQCNHCTTTEHLSLSLNDWGELHFICEHCRCEHDTDELLLSRNAAEKTSSGQDRETAEANYDLIYHRFEAVQNMLCDWLDEMEDQGCLSAGEHDALEASIYDVHP